MALINSRCCPLKKKKSIPNTEMLGTHNSLKLSVATSVFKLHEYLRIWYSGIQLQQNVQPVEL